mgnify:CR=1 FL=1
MYGGNMALVPGIVLLLDLTCEEEDRERLEHAHNEQHGIRSVDLNKALPRPEQHRNGAHRQ